MVAVDVAVERDLPVRSDEGAFDQQFHVGEPECVEHTVVAAEPGIEIEGGVGLEDGEDHAASLLAGKLREAVRLGVDLAELLSTRDPDERSLGVVAPGVVGAGEASGLPAAIADDQRATMPTGVDECLDPAIGLAHGEDRHAGDLDRAVRARLGEMSAQRSDDGPLAEQDVDLAFPTAGVEVVVDRHGEGVVERVGGVLVEVGEQPAGHLVPVVLPRGAPMVVLGRLRESSVRGQLCLTRRAVIVEFVGGHAGTSAFRTATGMALETTIPVTGS